jgi:hypothetical protein
VPAAEMHPILPMAACACFSAPNPEFSSGSLTVTGIQRYGQPPRGCLYRQIHDSGDWFVIASSFASVADLSLNCVEEEPGQTPGLSPRQGGGGSKVDAGELLVAAGAAVAVDAPARRKVAVRRSVATTFMAR